MTYRVQRIDSGPSSITPGDTRLKVTIYNSAGLDTHNAYIELPTADARDPELVLAAIASTFSAYTPNDFPES